MTQSTTTPRIGQVIDEADVPQEVLAGDFSSVEYEHGEYQVSYVDGRYTFDTGLDRWVFGEAR